MTTARPGQIRQCTVVLILTCVLIGLISSSCSRSGEESSEVISVGAEDKEMNAAIAKAQETLPQFWQAFEKRENGDEDFALKVKIQDGENVEHFWVVDIERKDGKLLGTISNEPEFVGNVKMGQQISIPEADISDWVYTHDGKMVGNHTLRALFKHMPAGEVEKYRQMLADP